MSTSTIVPEDETDAGGGPAVPAGPRRRRSSRWRRFKWAVRIGVLVLVVGKFIVGFDSFFYYPTRNVIYTPNRFGLDFEDVTFAASDGVKLHGWFLPAQGAARGTVVHFHGNAENITGHVVAVTWLPEAGYNVLAFDYRGYGQSEGRVTRAGTIRDGHAAIDYVLSRPDVDPQRVFVFGQSIGGAIATVVVAERPEVWALVVDSTFSSYRRIAALHLQKAVRLRWLANGIAWLALSGDYDPIDYVGRLSPRPLLVIVSGEDDICYPELGRELYEAANDPKALWFLPEAEHTEALFLEYDEARQRIIGAFESAAANGS